MLPNRLLEFLKYLVLTCAAYAFCILWFKVVVNVIGVLGL